MSGLRLGSKLLALTALNLSFSPLIPLLFLLAFSLPFDFVVVEEADLRFVIEAEVGLDVVLFVEPFGLPGLDPVAGVVEEVGRGGLKGLGGILFVISSVFRAFLEVAVARCGECQHFLPFLLVLYSVRETNRVGKVRSLDRGCGGYLYLRRGMGSGRSGLW